MLLPTCKDFYLCPALTLPLCLSSMPPLVLATLCIQPVALGQWPQPCASSTHGSATHLSGTRQALTENHNLSMQGYGDAPVDLSEPVSGGCPLPLSCRRLPYACALWDLPLQTDGWLGHVSTSSRVVARLQKSLVLYIILAQCTPAPPVYSVVPYGGMSFL